ncbi:glycosyltransferase [Hymenobacter sp. RP-2-7]|uniref:Glycosyltransferase n=1 Tax=Hymenobacter polaris TaxID=2682546 RepID=A0A7Y0AAL7_9BACT|nr:glycosyltransferase [Hymenobacter polaris]NML63803.1 glycosyltransferase [Hymenobacter polaris]
MAALIGGSLLLVAALYAGVWAWLRAAFKKLQVDAGVGFATHTWAPNPTPGPSPPGEGSHGGAVLNSSGSPLPEGRGRGWGERQGDDAPQAEGNSAGQELLFSVLVAARNEADALPTLLAALGAQSLLPACFEVLVADDHSTDATAAVVAQVARTAPFSLRLVELPPGHAGKKAALTAAEAQARAPWVVCTDADCRPGPGWLAAYATLLQTHSFKHSPIHFISGPVRLTPGGAWFDGLLALEFAGLMGVGAGCIGRGRPTMCNGANLAFRRASFHAVGGYADNARLASGDDEFLLHKLHQRYPGGIRFLADARAVVDTPAPATLGALLRQRVRWASKYPHYRPAAPRQLALLVLGTNVALALGLALGLAWPALRPWVAATWVLKLTADAWLLGPVLGLLRRRRWLAWLLPLQLLYAPYALAVGLAGRGAGGYRWKGRQVQ